MYEIGIFMYELATCAWQVASRIIPSNFLGEEVMGECKV